MHSTAPSKSSEVLRSTGELRPIVIVGFVAGILITAGIALAQHGLAAWTLAAISVSVVGVGLYRLRKETLLLRGRATTIATITAWERIEGSDGGYSYSVRYEFLTPDGRMYSGKETTQVELPAKGGLLPVSYRSDDPTKNLPLATFWFFKFTYTGFREWMER